MFNFEKTDDKIEIKNQNQFLIFVFFFLEILIIIAAIIDITKNGTLSAQGIMVIVISTLFLVIVGIYFYIDASTRLIIDNKGITKITKIKSQFMPWSEIKDFGVSYYTRSRYNIFYCLYFSKDILKEKNKYSKKLRGEMIKFIIEGKKNRETILKLLPFCTERASVSPFIGK